jgi:hypothetical protein
MKSRNFGAADSAMLDADGNGCAAMVSQSPPCENTALKTRTI